MSFPSVQVLTGPACAAPVAEAADGTLRFRFSAGPGLVQFSVIADANACNWDELYINLFEHHNKGQRTGPWDFDLLHNNKPLVPSYWVRMDGRDIGLWYFQRVSLEDMERRRFRGNTAFRLFSAGDHTLELRPYRPMPIRWMSAVLGPDPEDRLSPLPPGIRRAEGNVSAARWADPAFCREQRRRLETTHAAFAGPLRRSMEWALALRDPNPSDLPLLIAALRLMDRPDALTRAQEVIDAALALPAWGNTEPDGYGYNGDMGAMFLLRGLAWAWHGLGPEMGEARRGRLRERLARQGDAFVEMALLNRDYWGGSVRQDHGWRSMFGFGTAALYLLGVVPQAERWLEYVLPRVERSLEAMPLDGVMPASSYHSPHLYVDDVAQYRQALLDLTGRDILDLPLMRRIIPSTRAVLSEQDHAMLVTGQGDRVTLVSGTEFFCAVAARHRDREAAALARAALETPEISFYHGTQRRAFYQGVLGGFTAYDPTVTPAEAPAGPRRHLLHFDDSGMVHYRDDASGVVLSLRCGPWLGYNAHQHLTCPCDRLGTAPGEGHFTLFLRGVPLLVTPDPGYRLHSFLCSCLLVDDRGQYGDVGYTMSIPSFPYRGQRIVSVEWDPASGRGRALLDLKPAYPDDMDMAHYTREFLFAPERRIVVRDHVVLGAPRRLAWLFQGSRKTGVSVAGLRGRFGSDPALFVEPAAGGPALRAAVRETEVVWSYSSAHDFIPFDHVRYDTTEPAASALVQFVFTW